MAKNNDLVAKILQPSIQIAAVLIAFGFLHKEITELFGGNLLYKIGVIVFGIVWIGAWIWGLIQSGKDVDGNQIAWKVWGAFIVFAIIFIAPASTRKVDKEDHIEAPLK